MKEKIVLITGANSGIGKETTRALAKKGATIIMACRNLEKAGLVCKMIQTESKRGETLMRNTYPVFLDNEYFTFKLVKGVEITPKEIQRIYYGK